MDSKYTYPRRYSPDTLVIGAVALSTLKSIRIQELLPFYEMAGIPDYQPNEWYPLEPLIKMVEAIMANRKGMEGVFDFVSMGISNGLNIPLPPEVDTIEKYFAVFNERYKQLYRGTDTGYMRCEKISDSHFKFYFRWPWPDDIAFGMLHGMCKRFLPPGTDYRVHYDEDAERADFGGKETALHIEL